VEYPGLPFRRKSLGICVLFCPLPDAGSDNAPYDREHREDQDEHVDQWLDEIEDEHPERE